MKNGYNKIFTVKKSFIISNKIIIMEGDQLEYVLIDR
jgi:hypothetical protein